jgi:hypothetical protein
MSGTAIVQPFNLVHATLDDDFYYHVERRGYGHRDTHELWTVTGRPLSDMTIILTQAANGRSVEAIRQLP